MFAEVVFPSAPSSFTYSMSAVVSPSEAKEGDLVSAPFRSRYLNGLVISVFERAPDYKVKPIKEIVEKSVLVDWQVAAGLWLAEYYHAHLGKTFRLFIPERVWSGNPLKRKVKTEAIKAILQPVKKLNKAQELAVAEMLNSPCSPDKSGSPSPFAEGGSGGIFLLHGVTGSGKTEVYLRVIQKTLKQGKQVILLVPEIALTPQLIGYFASSIPSEQIAVLHSNLAEGAKLLVWNRIKTGEVKLVIGSRSALFAPARELGLIILDEEHEWNYKNDQTPRYHARAVALKMSELTGAKLVLGSATPSLETYYATEKGRVRLLELPRRIADVALPKVLVADLRNEIKRQNYSIFSEVLTEKIQIALERQEQVILFLNKRGFSSAIVCRDCGEAVTCRSCDLPLTYHRSNERVVCHICGYFERPPAVCPHCRSSLIRFLGTGTQKLESEIKRLFPTARILRCDRDTVSTRESHTRIYETFRRHEADILVGTQLVAKGLDIPKVSLVGVLLADIGLHLPDFRAAEKTFSLLTQVAGRAGRRSGTGEVVVQTYSPEHPVIRAAVAQDYGRFYREELKERKVFGYPPFGRLVKFAFVDRDEKIARRQAETLAEKIRLTKIGRASLAPALVARIHDKYHWHVIWRGSDPRELFKKVEVPEGCRIDVDPVSLV